MHLNRLRTRKASEGFKLYHFVIGLLWVVCKSCLLKKGVFGPMNPWINYHHLYYFKVIAEEGSVTQAARTLRVGQPTLSSQLKQFEESLGILLFHRNHKRLELTEQGKVTLDYAKSIFKMGGEMYEVLQDRLSPTKLTLHIGALDSIPKHMILKLAQSALNIESCQITLSENDSDALIRELTNHKMDLVVTNFLPIGPDARGLEPKLISKKNIAFYGAPKFKDLKKNFPQSISEVPLILPTYDSKLRYDLSHWAKLNDLKLNIIVESQDISVKKLMAVSGLGIIPVATHSISNQIKNSELVEIGKLKGVYEEIFLLSVKRRIPNPIATKILSNFKISL